MEKVLLYDGKEAAKFNIHESEPNALVNGTWDSIGPPLADATKTSESAKKLLYVTGF